MTLPHEFAFSEERSSTSSISSNDLPPGSPLYADSNEHLLDFVVTTVDQIDLAIYTNLESIGLRVITN